MSPREEVSLGARALITQREHRRRKEVDKMIWGILAIIGLITVLVWIF
jgi:hypothetical protein